MLSLRSVTKKIKKKYLADELDMHVAEGSLYALVGVQGSGKTSALRLAAGMLTPDSGVISINGTRMEAKDREYRRSRILGYMDEANGVYPNLRVLEYLEFFSHAHGEYGLSARERCMEVLQMAGLERRADTLLESLPESTQRQIEFLRTLLHRPRLLLLDNPFAGMDTYERLMTQELITRLAAEGMTIVLTSDSLPAVLEFCREIGLIDGGHMLAEGSREEVMDRIRESAPLYLEVRNGQEAAAALLRADPQVRSLTYDHNYFMVHYAGNGEQEAALLKKLVEAGISICSFHRGQGSLEDLSRHLA